MCHMYYMYYMYLRKFIFLFIIFIKLCTWEITVL